MLHLYFLVQGRFLKKHIIVPEKLSIHDPFRSFDIFCCCIYLFQYEHDNHSCFQNVSITNAYHTSQMFLLDRQYINNQATTSSSHTVPNNAS